MSFEIVYYDWLHLALILFFGHLIGDFFLQNEKIIRWKEKSLKGILVHVLILSGVTYILLLPYLLNAVHEMGRQYLLGGVASIYILHFLIDWAKVTVTKRFPQFGLHWYVLDQFLHLIVIVMMAWSLQLFTGVGASSSLFYEFYFAREALIYVILLMLVTYPWEVTRYIIELHRVKQAQYRQEKNRKKPLPVFKPNARDMLLRGVVVSALFALVIPWTAYASSYDTERRGRIDDIQPSIFKFGEEVTVTGGGFGFERDEFSQVCWGDFCVNADSITLWSDSEIKFKMNVLGMPSQGVLHVIKLHESGIYTEDVTGTNITVIPTIASFQDQYGNAVHTLVSGQQVTMKGYYFGNAIGTIKLGSTIVSSVASWTN